MLPQTTTLMKQKTLTTLRHPDILRIVRWMAWALAIAIALGAWPAWRWFAYTYGPYTCTESQCLICHRERTIEVSCGRQTFDRIDTNEYSDWIDTFVPEHEHVWLGHTDYYRGRWFGNKSIGCGGIPTLSTIYQQREKIGEDQARRLVLKFHELVRTRDVATDGLKELDEFTLAIHNDPESLLKEEPQK